MKAKIYLRVAKGPRGTRVTASPTPNYVPLTAGSGYDQRNLPTAMFSLVLNIPEDKFREAERVMAELDIPPGAIEMLVEVGDEETD